MKCKNTPKSYPTNQVFSTIQPGINDEWMRGVKMNETITRCSEDFVLKKYKEHSTSGSSVAYRNLESDRFKYNLPVGYNEIPDCIKDPKCKRFEKTSNRLTLDELDLIIREELARKRHSIKCLFKENSLNTNSEVSRGALLKILKSLCPLMDMELFHRLIERYELHKEALVSFRQFEESFTAPPLGRQNPPVIFHGLGAERCVSVAQAYRMLRQIACDSRFDLKAFLPPSCFETDGRVLCPQLREAMRLMRIHLTDENYRRLWRDKFDLGRFGSIRTVDLCKALNLKDDGTPSELKAKVIPLMTANLTSVPKLDKYPALWTPSEWPKFEMLPPFSKDATDKGYKLIRDLPTAGGTSFPVNEPSTWEAKGPGGANQPVMGCGERYKTRLENLETHCPKFEDVMECLRYKFENPYQSMLVAFKRMDPGHTNRVRENECLLVLREFGLNIESECLHAFLRRILSASEATGFGLGSDKPPHPFDPHEARAVIKPGMVPYKRLLSYYQNRTMGSPAQRTIRYLEAKGEATAGVKTTPLTTPDELEQELIKLLHKSFIHFFIDLCKNEDKNALVHEDKFKNLVNGVIGFTMSDAQWQKLRPYLYYGEPELVNFDHFLSLFNQPTNVARRLATEIFDASKWHCQTGQDDSRGEIRDKATLLRLVEHTIRTRLHHIDKTYKHYDQLEVNMLCKEDFGELLSNQGLDLTLAELDYLWGLLDALEPNRTLHNYRQVMNFFYNRTRPIVAEMMRLKRYSKTRAIQDPNVETLRKWRAELKQRKSKDESDLLKAGKIASELPPRLAISNKPAGEELDQICGRIAADVQKHWDALQRAFIDADRSGATKLLFAEFKSILRQFNFGITESEMERLCHGFASREKDYVAYFKFMNYFTKTLPKESPLGTLFDERTYQFTNQKNGEKLGFAQVLREIRKACTSQWRTLQEAFNKFDSNRQGVLSMQQIDQILRKRGIQLSRDDLYHLLTSFDSGMSGCINFRDFKRTALKAFKPVAGA